MSNLNQEKSGRVTHLPEHGPIDEKNGKEILLSVKNVDITFGKGDSAVKAVKNASFDIYKGETFSLVGESGSGKTTVGRAVIRVNPCASGEILYKGVRISGKIPHSLDREVIRNIQMVFQDPAASGGQRQRIGLARAMVMEPELVVADEPISALDVSIRAQVLNLLKKFQVEKNVTYLFIAHDLSIVRFISDRIGVIYKGNIVEIAEADELFDFPLHPYTHSLISAIPIPDPKLEKNKVLYTYDPSMHDYSTDQPELVNIGHEHYVYGNRKEIEEYRAIREKGVPLKSINIVDPNASQQNSVPQRGAVEHTASEDEFLQAPVHDTGSIWYKIFSFLLPVIGLIAAFVFRHFHYYRNYTACKKGAITGLIVIAAIIVLFLVLLILAVI